MARHQVKGHYRDGKWVEPHSRTARDGSAAAANVDAARQAAQSASQRSEDMSAASGALPVVEVRMGEDGPAGPLPAGARWNPDTEELVFDSDEPGSILLVVPEEHEWQNASVTRAGIADGDAIRIGGGNGTATRSGPGNGHAIPRR